MYLCEAGFLALATIKSKYSPTLKNPEDAHCPEVSNTLPKLSLYVKID